MTSQFNAEHVVPQLKSSQEFFDRSTRVLEEADSTFAPQEGLMTVAQQVAHTASVLTWFVEGSRNPEGFDLDFETQVAHTLAVTSLTAAREKLADAYAKTIAYAASLSPEDLAKPMSPGPIMGGEPVINIFWAMLDHSAHHRGALTVYTRLLGKVPVMPYGG